MNFICLHINDHSKFNKRAINVHHAPKYTVSTQIYLLRSWLSGLSARLLAVLCSACMFYLRCAAPAIATLLPAQTAGSCICRGPEILCCHRHGEPGIITSSPRPEYGRDCPFVCSPVHVSEAGLQSGLKRPQSNGEQI
jgi:hypothetical protein